MSEKTQKEILDFVDAEIAECKTHTGKDGKVTMYYGAQKSGLQKVRDFIEPPPPKPEKEKKKSKKEEAETGPETNATPEIEGETKVEPFDPGA